MKKFIPVLAYHSFDVDRFPGNKLAISSGLFKKQLEWINASGREGISLAACAKVCGVMGFWGKKVALTFDDGYIDNYEQAFPLLGALKLPGTFFVTPEAVGTKGFVTWEMVAEMARTPGIEIGSHGLFHKPLADISRHESRCSIFDSKKIIEDKIGLPVRAFSYPSGSFSDEIVATVKEAGYEYACAASHVHDTKYLRDPFLIRRIKISSSSSTRQVFGWRLSGFYHAFGRP